MKIPRPRRRENERWQAYRIRVTNNLHLNFPMGHDPCKTSAPPDQSYYLWCAGENADKPSGPYPGDASLKPENRHSDLKARQTPRQFQAKFLEVTTGLGIDFPSFQKKLNQSYLADRASDDGIDWDSIDREVAETIIKVYIAMRKLGYTWRDLCG